MTSDQAPQTFDEWWRQYEGRAWHDASETQCEEIWDAGVASVQAEIERLREALRFIASRQSAEAVAEICIAEARNALDEWDRDPFGYWSRSR